MLFLQAAVVYNSSAEVKLSNKFKEALYWVKLAGDKVQCILCPYKCVLKAGQKGFCKARKNIDGKLYSLTYGQPVAVHADPIEKKPLYHVFPGTKSLSIATAGCNLRCKFCQNWEISQLDAEKVKVRFVPPEEIIALTESTGSKTIAFTYTEPIIFYEYMLDIAKLAKKKGIDCVMHSAGYINEKPLRELCKYITAANIDLKGFSDKFYSSFCSGDVQTVLNTLKILKEEGVWVETTTLLIPGANDSEEELTELCEWIVENLGANTPVHFSRFYPMFRLTNLSPTPVSTLIRAYNIAKKTGLNFVYVGNVSRQIGNNTICPKCNNLLIKRVGYNILKDNIENRRCKFCGYKVPGVWKK